MFEKQLKPAKRIGSQKQQDEVKDWAKLITATRKDAKSKGKSEDDDTAAPEAPTEMPGLHCAVPSSGTGSTDHQNPIAFCRQSDNGRSRRECSMWGDCIPSNAANKQP